MSEPKNEDKQQQQQLKKPINGKKRKFKGKRIATLLLAGMVVGGSIAQVSYNSDNTEKAVTEQQLDDIRKGEEFSELDRLGEYIESDKVSDLAKAGDIAEKYSDAEKLKELKDTYVKLLKQTVANTYEIDEKKVTLNEEDKIISISLAKNVTINLYSRDFLTTNVEMLGKQALTLINGNMMSSEFNTAFEDIAEIDEFIKKCEKGEITVSDIRDDLKEIYEHKGIFQIAKGKSNGKNIGLEHPEQKETKNKDKEPEGQEPGE